MDFYRIKERSVKKGLVEIYPDFRICRSKDLMVRGKAFYAIWDEEAGLWSTDEYDVQRLIDKELAEYYEEAKKRTDAYINVKYLGDYSSKSWMEFRNYVSHISDSYHDLDTKLTFANTEVKKNTYASKRLPYPLESGSTEAYDEIVSTLYDSDERDKIEWAIGAIISGDARNIQKFIVFYGEFGSGKSTIINIILKLFDGYYTTFDAKALASNSNAFSTEVFKSNPLVAIQHDGDLSKIEDNTKINSIVSHEEMIINEKFKSSYTSRINAFLFMGTNKPVKITDGKSGIIRRLIDVKPSGNKIPPKRYDILTSKIDFELSGIAYKCLETYKRLGKNYYQSYRPLDMMFKTDVFFNFVESNYYIFEEQDGCTLTQAYDLYKRYCDESLVDIKLPRYKFREELKNYFKNFELVSRVDGKQVRSYYSGFIKDKFSSVYNLDSIEKPSDIEEDEELPMDLNCTKSIFDEQFSDYKAQYAVESGVPRMSWDKVRTTLKSIDTSRVHFVKLPENHIVIDFDLKDKNGEKSKLLNLEAASKWPETYAEFSKSGNGVHLHYIYDGDPLKLKNVYSEGIEIKVYKGNSALRRKLTKCNDIPIATISSGLPLREEKRMINYTNVKNEKQLRDLIEANLRKEIHPSTASSISFIHKLLDDAYNSGIAYDVSEMQQKIKNFAQRSSNQPRKCLRMVMDMKFKSDNYPDNIEFTDDSSLVFFDVEVYPNLFLICYKEAGEKNRCKSMVNPRPQEVEKLFSRKLVGFNNRKYDNHICYAAYLGYNNRQLYQLSQKIVSGGKDCFFPEAYNISYTDLYDLCQKKQSLKKWEIELGIHHLEIPFRWDEPVPETMWPKVIEYCCNDVVATEEVYKNNMGDVAAREILSDISGLTNNDTTNQHTTKIIFQNDREPQREFVYTDLSTIFPGYRYDKYGIDKREYAEGVKIVNGKSIYKRQDPSEGGRVYAKVGVWGNVGLMDISSMHPSSIIALNLFGDNYTNRFKMLRDSRLMVKRLSQAFKANDQKMISEYQDKIASMFDGALVKYTKDPSLLDALSGALKIAINSVYGLTSAKFDNKFRDPRNIDNIVAKRGALFMIDLQEAVEAKGYTVVHIKTDSIKVADFDDEIKEFIMEFGKKYGYNFEHEATYEKMCLVNDAVYIAQYRYPEDHVGEWTATGAQFAHPYVFKTLFSKEPIVFRDMCETKTVKSALYLDMNENLKDVTIYEKELDTRLKIERTGKNHRLNPDLKEYSNEQLSSIISEGHDYQFVGRAGSFCPVRPGCGGGELLRQQNDKYYFVSGSSGYRWLEEETVSALEKQDDIDKSYFELLVQDAADQILQYADLQWFCSDEKYISIGESPIWPF